MLKVLNDEKNITKAAEKLFTSQPALTYRIKQLERDLGSTILWRNKRGVTFSTEGEYLVEYALRMLREFQYMQDKIQNINHMKEGTIRFGCSGNFGRFLLPEILSSFKEQHDKVRFSMFTGLSSEIQKMTEDDDIYVGIVRGNTDWPDEKITLFRENISIISKEPIDFNQLPYLPRIVFKTDVELQGMFDRWWQQNYKVPPNISMRLDNIESTTKLVLNGLGYAILPSIGIREFKDDLYIYPIKDEHGNELFRETHVIFKQSSSEFSIVSLFIDFLKDYFNEEHLSSEKESKR
jgi:DNA-binding transcriptional LysR family regulator